MPIYEYECNHCGDNFEMIQGFSDKPLKKCKKCGGRLHKLVSECSFRLKGTGWYVTDYGKSGKTQAPAKKESTSAKADSQPKAESKPAESKSSPKKPATTTETKKSA